MAGEGGRRGGTLKQRRQQNNTSKLKEIEEEWETKWPQLATCFVRTISTACLVFSTPEHKLQPLKLASISIPVDWPASLCITGYRVQKSASISQGADRSCHRPLLAVTVSIPEH